ncbi:tetratricopeptide repeat protein [Amycolatopsis pithecellobii]|uniref:Tetratricopeptide repeat protein n=1 Tax=Amycolatopsis pithecellobii TaxID=664692 RepID=A0A6N7YYV8_9PSEU|nr:tetratricopeptide repeat protein [Amycolatopsis pithecellobii]MTD57062.1 tetratricopeptide repeat protein [Amycolatopsis pithecellobii]
MNPVVWLRPAAEHEAHLAAAVSEAAELFEVDTHGLELAEAVRILGERAPDDLVWILDGVRGELRLPGSVVRPSPDLPDVEAGPLSEPARVVLDFVAALAPAPVGADLLMAGVSDLLGPRAPLLVAGALTELAAFVAPASGESQAWQAICRLEPTAHGVRRAATVLERFLRTPTSLVNYRHALEVARHPAASSQRTALLRAVARGYEQRGDFPAAAQVWGLVAAGGDPADVLAAARREAETGDPPAAIRRTARLIQGARRAHDVRTEYRARFVAALAHDANGSYARADKVFHRHPLIAAQGPEPVWLGADERREVRLARVQALRLRGEYRVARELLDTLLPEIRRAQPFGSHRGAWPVATLEDARLLLLAGDLSRSREVAGRLAGQFARAGWARHPLARGAVAVLVEGEHGAGPARRAAADSVAWFGHDHALTLELRILQAQALSNDGENLEALAVLADAEVRAEAGLGADHPLTLKARQWRGLVRMRLRDWETAARQFEELAPRQELAFGADHPDTRLTRLELGVCLARLNHVRRARPLLTEAVKALHDEHGPWQHWVSTARAATALAELPGPVSRWFTRARAQPRSQPTP